MPAARPRVEVVIEQRRHGTPPPEEQLVKAVAWHGKRDVRTECDLPEKRGWGDRDPDCDLTKTFREHRARMGGPTRFEVKMTDLLDRIRDELDTRLNELRPLLAEHDRLAAALQALGNADRPAVSRGRGSAARSAPAKRRRHAPRGANRQAVLDAVRERPGASAGDLAAASGVARNSLYALLTRLVEEGELVKRDLPTGQIGYAPKP